MDGRCIAETNGCASLVGSGDGNRTDHEMFLRDGHRSWGRSRATVDNAVEAGCIARIGIADGRA